ncbi:MAG: glycosyltransferase, partial [Candidatus Asgardarchaeia archaeon]
MKIAITSDFFYPSIGGIEKHIEGFAKTLSNVGFDVTIITSREREDFNDNQFNFKVIRLGCIRIPTINIMALRRYYSLLNDILIINSFDLMHAHHAFTPTSLFSIEIASKLKIPSVLTAH